MALFDWTKWLRRAIRKPASRKPRCFRPRLDVLEDRLAPASTITVTTLADGAGVLDPPGRGGSSRMAIGPFSREAGRQRFTSTG